MSQTRLEHMRSMFRGELAKLREQLLLMASITEKNFLASLTALVERDDRKADEVEVQDTQIDRMEIEIDDLVITLMATHAPMASAGRLMLTTSKICNSLENIGDQAVTIARRTRKLNLEPELKPMIDIPRMGNITVEMMHGAIDAFVNMDAELAKNVARRDPEVDGLKHQLERELTSYMIENPATINRALHLMLVARCIERAADSAKSISEQVYFLYTAEDMRHEKNIAS